MAPASASLPACLSVCLTSPPPCLPACLRPAHPPAADGSWVSMGVYSDGSYGAPPGVVYSFPVTCKDGKWSIVQVGAGVGGLRGPWVGVGAKRWGGVRRDGLAAQAGRHAYASAQVRCHPHSTPPSACLPNLSSSLPLPPLPCLQGLPIDEASAAKMKATGDELVEEKQLAMECLGEA